MAALEALVEALRRLPGVGVKSAQRMAYHLLQHDRPGAQQLSQALSQAVQRVGHCRACNTFAETELCVTCADPLRDARQLCVVETPADQAVLERSGHFKGRYFVLLGRLSPLDGVGVESLGVDKLLGRLDEQGLEEIILATSFTAEGEATAHVLTQLMQARGLNVTRLARGVPAGSEIEYVDPGTLAHALADRR